MTNQGFGDIVLVSPQSSSVSEHLADIVLTLGFSMDQDVAQNLMSGIMSATKNFQDPKTSSLAFEVAAFLMKSGGRRAVTANDQMFSAQPEPKSTAFVEPQRQSQPVQQPVESTPAMPQEEPQQVQSGQVIADQQDDDAQDEPPLDWLTPKVYKGSSEV